MGERQNLLLEKEDMGRIRRKAERKLCVHCCFTLLHLNLQRLFIVFQMFISPRPLSSNGLVFGFFFYIFALSRHFRIKNEHTMDLDQTTVMAWSLGKLRSWLDEVSK